VHPPWNTKPFFSPFPLSFALLGQKLRLISYPPLLQVLFIRPLANWTSLLSSFFTCPLFLVTGPFLGVRTRCSSALEFLSQSSSVGVWFPPTLWIQFLFLKCPSPPFGALVFLPFYNRASPTFLFTFDLGFEIVVGLESLFIPGPFLSV